MGRYLERARLFIEKMDSQGYEINESTKEPGEPVVIEEYEDEVTKTRLTIFAKKIPWVVSCREMAQALGWPDVDIQPHMSVGGGEFLWRLYLTKAPITQLRDWVYPRLRQLIVELPSPPCESYESDSSEGGMA